MPLLWDFRSRPLLCRWHGCVGTICERVGNSSRHLWHVLRWLGYLPKCQKIKNSLLRQESGHSIHDITKRQTSWMGRGVGLPRSDTKEWENVWMFHERAHKEILPMRKCHISYRWPIKRHGDAQTGRDTLCSDSYVWHRSDSCIKSRWASTTESRV